MKILFDMYYFLVGLFVFVDCLQYCIYLQTRFKNNLKSHKSAQICVPMLSTVLYNKRRVERSKQIVIILMDGLKRCTWKTGPSYVFKFYKFPGPLSDWGGGGVSHIVYERALLEEPNYFWILLCNKTDLFFLPKGTFCRIWIE